MTTLKMGADRRRSGGKRERLKVPGAGDKVRQRGSEGYLNVSCQQDVRVAAGGDLIL